MSKGKGVKFDGFEQPSMTVLSGYSGCGKTSTVREFLMNGLVKRIDTLTLLCEYPNENVYEQIKQMCMLHNPFCKLNEVNGSMALDKVIKSLDAGECNLLIVDDQLNTTEFNLSKIAGVESRHKNCTTFLITQNIFSDKRDFLHFKRQVRYFVLFNDGDSSTSRFLKTRFPQLRHVTLPASRFYIGDTHTKNIYDESYNLISFQES